MKNLKLLLLFLSLSSTHITIGSQTDSDSENAINYLVSSQVHRTYSAAQALEEAQINDGYNFSQARTLSTHSYQIPAVQDAGYNAPQMNRRHIATAVSHAPTQQEQISLTQYSLASATQESQFSQKSTVSTQIDPTNASSQDSNYETQLHRDEELTPRSQHAQGNSYLFRVSSHEDN